MTNLDPNRRTEELVNRWAHDAGIAAADEEVKGRAGLRSQEAARRGEGGWVEAAEHLALTGGIEGATHAAEHAAERYVAKQALKGLASRVGVGAGAGVAGHIVFASYELYKYAWADAHAKGDNLRNLAHNDAVNVALAQSLAFHEKFGVDEAARRPGVEQNTGKLRAELAGRDASIKPVFQGRADEGFVAAERAWAATASVPTAERGAAMQKWYADNGFQERLRTDVAFGKGVEYHNWCKAQPASTGVSFDAEAKKVHDRLVPPQPFVRQL